MDDQAKQASPSTRHRLDPGFGDRDKRLAETANRGLDAARESRASYDGPCADTKRAGSEMGQAERRIERLDFGAALQFLREGKRVARTGWNGKGQFLAMAFGAMFVGPSIGENQHTGTFIVIQPVSGPLVPWVASQTDLLAQDWCFVREVPMLVYGHGGE